MLDYTCMICGVTISHAEDPNVVLKVAAHHNAVMHVQSVRLGDWRVEWPRPVMGAVSDKLVASVIDHFDGRRIDVWGDQFGFEWTPWDDDVPVEEVLEVVAAHVGPDLHVIDQWRSAS